MVGRIFRVARFCGIFGCVVGFLAVLRGDWRAWALRDPLFIRPPLDERALELQREQLALQQERTNLLREVLGELREQRRLL